MHFSSTYKISYVTHKVINQDSRYHLSIILSINETSFEELRIIFKHDKVVFLPLAFIFELKFNETRLNSMIKDF